MLQAILLNKAGRNINSNEVHWRQLFTASEDSLTSTIFGTLLYLPRVLFWRVLHNAIYDCILPVTDNKIETVEYWPHWQANKSTNSNFIEPDIFIRTINYDLIVEAKRHDYDQQYKSQWENEFQGYLNQYGKDGKDVFLLAVGGISIEKNETIQINKKTIKVVKCRWGKILNEIKKVKFEIEKIGNNYPNIESISVILNDLIIGFRIHGYATGEWFENTDFKINNDIRNSSIMLLENNTFIVNFINWNLPLFEDFRINQASLNYFINKN